MQFKLVWVSLHSGFEPLKVDSLKIILVKLMQLSSIKETSRKPFSTSHSLESSHWLIHVFIDAQNTDWQEMMNNAGVAWSCLAPARERLQRAAFICRWKSSPSIIDSLGCLESTPARSLRQQIKYHIVLSPHSPIIGFWLLSTRQGLQYITVSLT